MKLRIISRVKGSREIVKAEFPDPPPQSRDILRASEPGNSQNLNGNLNSLVSQEVKESFLISRICSKATSYRTFSEKLKLPL